jgi:hypothetical protein
MHAQATTNPSAIGFAGLASLVSTIPDPAPAMVAPPQAGSTPPAKATPSRARTPLRWAGLGAGVAIFAARILVPVTHPTVPVALQTPQTYYPSNLMPQNLAPPAAASPPFALPSFAPQTFAPPLPQRAGSSSAPLPWPSTISEVKPPPGTELTLSASQILYCLAQKIRLDTMEPVVDRTSAAQVGAFNGLVEDYDQRCLSYHYRRADMEAAQRLVELTRGILANEAKTQVAAWH